MSLEFDPGPTPQFADIFERAPDYFAVREHFAYDWGPVFFRGRLDGSARVLAIASDPGPTEHLANRVFAGDAGQKAQGFLSKVGLTRSYLCLNAFLYEILPGHAHEVGPLLARPEHLEWRNELYDAAAQSVQAVVAFGDLAQQAVALWPGRDRVPLFEVPHPNSRNTEAFLSSWRKAVLDLRHIVAADSDVEVPPNYGPRIAEHDYAAIPRRDMPFGAPAWLGDDHRGRAERPPRLSSVTRPNQDNAEVLLVTPPRSDKMVPPDG